jgi:formate hydrogenlyase subunit 3/multisubunit Na+/H+ antiporter MnhD subunit
MQLRTLILQKQHDPIWIVSLVLVCVSILSLFGLAFVLYVVVKGDIRNPQQQVRLERFNNFALFIIIFISIINVLINIFMSTTNPKSFLDTRSLEILQQQQN